MVIGAGQWLFNILKSVSKSSDELLLVLKKDMFQLTKKQQATYPSTLTMIFKIKKSHCPAPIVDAFPRGRVVVAVYFFGRDGVV